MWCNKNNNNNSNNNDNNNKSNSISIYIYVDAVIEQNTRQIWNILGKNYIHKYIHLFLLSFARWYFSIRKESIAFEADFNQWPPLRTIVNWVTPSFEDVTIFKDCFKVILVTEFWSTDRARLSVSTLKKTFLCSIEQKTG